MPPAVAIPLAVAGAGMVATNVNNKAAIKNNETQQASAVGNAQQAYQTAQNNVTNWLGSHPSPIAGMTPGAPPQPGAYGQGGVMAPHSYNVRGGPSTGTVAPQSPLQIGGGQGVGQLLQRILGGAYGNDSAGQRGTEITQRALPPAGGPAGAAAPAMTAANAAPGMMQTLTGSSAPSQLGANLWSTATPLIGQILGALRGGQQGGAPPPGGMTGQPMRQPGMVA